MSYAWVVVADAAVAKIYATNKHLGALTPVTVFQCDEARLHEQELTSDRAGRSFDSFGAGRHETSAPTSSKQQIAIRFAKSVSKFLGQGRVKKDFDQLIIVAEPKFLGLLSGSLDAEVAKLVWQKFSKDFTKHDDEEIRQYLIKVAK